jgi:hypothetical protein
MQVVAAKPDPVHPETRWFVLLQPAEPPAAWTAINTELSALTGGAVDPLPHLTVATGRGEADPDAVRAAFASSAAPDLVIRLQPPVKYLEGERLHFRWTISARVERDEALRAWFQRANDALRSVGLTAWTDFENWGAHVTVLRGSATIPPPPAATRDAAIQALEGRLENLRFPATELRVTRLAHGTFELIATGTMGTSGSHS